MRTGLVLPRFLFYLGGGGGPRVCEAVGGWADLCAAFFHVSASSDMLELNYLPYDRLWGSSLFCSIFSAHSIGCLLLFSLFVRQCCLA